VIYKPTLPSTNGSSVTFYWYTAGKLHMVTGAKGNVKGTFEAGKIAHFDWEFQGRLVAPTDASIPGSLTFLSTLPPLFSSATSVIGSYSPVFRKLEFDLGNQIVRRDDANSVDGIQGFIIPDRAPSCTIDPESGTEATHPIWGDLSASTSRTISATLGSLGGNKCMATFIGESVSAPYGEANGIRTNTIKYDMTRALLSDTAGQLFQLKFF
jgi:hypothetical protein